MLTHEELQVQAALLQARIESARGQFASAGQRYASLLVRMQSHDLPLLTSEVLLWQVRLQFALGDFSAVQRWVSSRDRQNAELPLLHQEREEVLVARWLLASTSPLPLPDGTFAEPALYRKTRGEPWQKVWQLSGTMLLYVASHAAEPGVFYALGLGGVYRSSDTGLTWEQLALPWSEELARQFPQALVLSDESSTRPVNGDGLVPRPEGLRREAP